MKRLTLLTLAMALTLWARGENVFTLSPAEGAPGDTVTVSVALSNDAPVTALQLQLPLGGQTHYVDGTAALTARGADHAITAHEADGRLNIVVYSPTMKPIAGSEGTLLSVRLCLGRRPEALPLTLSRHTLRTAAGDTATARTAAGATLTTRCALATYSATAVDYGRVPICSRYTRALTISNTGNAPLTVTDLNFSSADFAAPDVQLPLTVAAGGSRTITLSYAPQERGTVGETLRVACNSTSRLNTVRLSARPFAVNELHVQPAAGICDSTVTVAVTMNNMDSITGLQLGLPLPDEVDYVPGSFALSERGGDMQLSVGQDGRTLTAVAYSTAGHAFAGHDGTVATLRLRLKGPNSTTLVPGHCALTARYRGQTMDVLSATTGAGVDISSPRLYMEQSVDMGRTPVPDTVCHTLTVQNWGNAPLHLSRAVFTRAGYATREALPLVVPAGSSRTLTLAYGGTARGAIDGVMRLYCNDPTARMAEVKLAGSRYVTNALTLDAGRAFKGRRATLTVNVENQFPIMGMQFDILYPTGTLKPTTDSTFATTARSAHMSVQWRAAGDTLRVFLYSLGGKPLAAGRGAVVRVHFDLAEGTAPGTPLAFTATGIKIPQFGIRIC